MLELWLNKAKEVEAVRDLITVVEPSGPIVEPSGQTYYRNILFNNLNPEKIRTMKAIVKDLMNLNISDSYSD